MNNIWLFLMSLPYMTAVSLAIFINLNMKPAVYLIASECSIKKDIGSLRAFKTFPDPTMPYI